MRASEQMTAHLPPPFLYLGMLVVGLVLSALFPTPVLSGPLPTLIGVLLVLLGIGLSAWGAITMRRVGESLNPNQPTRALVDNGPFRFSRNPGYLGLTALYAGIALVFGSLWALILLIVVLLIMDRGIIASEERYLQESLGEPYLEYKTRVRRWL